MSTYQPRPIPIELFALEHVVDHVKVTSSGCWNWTGRHQDRKYGRGRLIVRGEIYLAYRVSYELFIGRIPDGLAIDHLCRNPRCVNPTHLEPVTFAENARRTALPYCRKGHARVAGERQCGVCRREWTRQRFGYSPRFDGNGYHDKSDGFCRHGHALTEANIWVDPKGGYIQCRECMRIVNRPARAKYRAKKRAERLAASVAA